MSTGSSVYEAEEHNTSSVPSADWGRMPDMILASIFARLPVLDRMKAAQVCEQWNSASYHPKVWERFDYGVTEYCDLDTWKDFEPHFPNSAADHQLYVRSVCDYGEAFSRVHIVLHDSKSFEVFNEVAEECENLRMVKIARYDQSVDFPETFSSTLLLFLSGNIHLEEISLEGITIFKERPNLPVPIGPTYAKNLKKVSFINSFRQNNMSPLMYLINLHEFTISPEMIRYPVLLHLARASLHTVHLVAKPGMWEFDCKNLGPDQWRTILEASNSRLKINCYLIDTHECSGILLSAMPVVKLVVCRYMRFDYTHVVKMLRRYSTTLTTYIDFSLSDQAYTNEPSKAVDDGIITIVQSCPKLTALAVKDCLHSSTILLIAQLNRNLKNIFIREGTVYYELYIPDSVSDISQEMRTFTEENFSAKKFEGAMSQLLQFRWCVLPKKEYRYILVSRYARFS